MVLYKNIPLPITAPDVRNICLQGIILKSAFWPALFYVQVYGYKEHWIYGTV